MTDTNHRPHGNDARDQPVGELLKQLSEQTSTLVRQEMELARAELVRKGRTAGLGAGMLGGGGLFGLFALAVLTAAFVLVLATAMEAWLAALIVAAAYGAVAGALAITGTERLREAAPPVPEKTKDSVKEDVEWTRSAAKSGRA